MVQTRSADEASSRWETNAGNRETYVSGVENPLNDQAEATQEAAGRWGEAVRAAADQGLFTSAAEELSTSEWQEKALELGANRISQGVAQNVDKYDSAVEEYIDRIESTDLPARGPTGDVSTNIERARVMAQALRDQKTQG